MPTIVIPLTREQHAGIAGAAAWGGLSAPRFAARTLQACADHAKAAHYARYLLETRHDLPFVKLHQVVETFEYLTTTTDVGRPPADRLEWVTGTIRKVLPHVLVRTVSGEIAPPLRNSERALHVPLSEDAHQSIRRATALADRRISSWTRDCLLAAAQFAQISRDLRELGGDGPGLERLVHSWQALMRAAGSVSLPEGDPMHTGFFEALLLVAKGPQDEEVFSLDDIGVPSGDARDS